jgi:hypothetical protein
MRYVVVIEKDDGTKDYKVFSKSADAIAVTIRRRIMSIQATPLVSAGKMKRASPPAQCLRLRLMTPVKLSAWFSLDQPNRLSRKNSTRIEAPLLMSFSRATFKGARYRSSGFLDFFPTSVVGQRGGLPGGRRDLGSVKNIRDFSVIWSAGGQFHQAVGQSSLIVHRDRLVPSRPANTRCQGRVHERMHSAPPFDTTRRSLAENALERRARTL